MPPFTYKPPQHFQPKFLQRYFYLAHSLPGSSLSKLLHCKVSVVERQHENEASVHRTAKEFTVDRKSVVSATVHLKDQPAECLENTAVYTVASVSRS